MFFSWLAIVQKLELHFTVNKCFLEKSLRNMPQDKIGQLRIPKESEILLNKEKSKPTASRYRQVTIVI